MMGERIPYFFFDETTRRVCGFSIIAEENWDIQQRHLRESRPTHSLRMVRIEDPAILEALRSKGPHNFKVNAEGELELLPPEQHNLTAQVVVSSDDQLMTLNKKMDILIELIRNLPQAVGEATEAAMRRAIH
jgi:hypothetical protein